MKLHTKIMCALFLSISSFNAWSQETKTTTTTTTTTEDKLIEKPANPGVDSIAKPVEPKMHQESSEAWRGVHAGVVAQATFTDFKINSANGSINTSYVVGYGAGGFLGYFFSSHTELRLEALYSSLAQEYEKDGVKSKVNLSYINFPLLFGLHTGYDKPVNLNVMFGPQFGINTGSSLDGDGGSGIDTVQASVKVKPSDIGIAYGVGLDFGIGPERLLHLNVGYRGVFGIVDISDNSKNTTTNNYYVLDRSKVKTYSGYIGVSYKF